jgi:hypothetical protein
MCVKAFRLLGNIFYEAIRGLCGSILFIDYL